MSFSADWLQLREGADARARNQEVAAAVSAAFAGRSGLSVTDLGAGSGNNLRATAPFLGPGQCWMLIDNDAALLDLAEAPQGGTLVRNVLDLAAMPEAALRGEPDLVTASAFFDLVGADWLHRFVRSLSGTGAALYAVLSYDGREHWLPPHPLDEAARAAFHADQRRDKGFGPSLGPDAHAALVAALQAAGYAVTQGPSDWVLEAPADAELIAELAGGSARAVEPALGFETAAWRDDRVAASKVVIGHRDLLAMPPDK
ncbi:MAG: SAM-dependent methyltransferase [Pseudomonadota bacterium]